jgi:probable HAF family extracellular repeat protein
MKPLLSFIVAFSAVTVASAEQVRYTITDLGTLGGTFSMANSINELGQVVGVSYLPGDSQYRAFMWDGTMHALASPTDGNSFASGINDYGTIVGAYNTSNVYPIPGGYLSGDFDGATATAFIYRHGTMSPLGNIGGPNSTAMDVNNSERVVGYGDVTPAGGLGARHAFYYDGVTMVDLGTFGTAASNSAAQGVNNAGQVVGRAYTAANANYKAFIYSGGTMVDIGTLGGGNSMALGINDSGLVVGFSYTAGGEEHAFLYDGSAMHDLGTLEGAFSRAQAINNLNQVVGVSSVLGSSAPHAFLYENGSMFDLNALVDSGAGWTLITAKDINDKGRIVGYGLNANGEYHGYLLTPVPAAQPIPLPSAFVLGTAGVATMLVSRRMTKLGDRRKARA